MTKTLTAQQLFDEMDYSIVGANQTLSKFQENLATNPVYAFEWSDSSFAAAASKTVAMTVQAWMLKGGAPKDNIYTWNFENTPEGVREFCAMAAKEMMRDAIRQLEYPASSTSKPSNLMAERMGTARFNMARRLEAMAEAR